MLNLSENKIVISCTVEFRRTDNSTYEAKVIDIKSNSTGKEVKIGQETFITESVKNYLDTIYENANSIKASCSMREESNEWYVCDIGIYEVI